MFSQYKKAIKKQNLQLLSSLTLVNFLVACGFGSGGSNYDLQGTDGDDTLVGSANVSDWFLGSLGADHIDGNGETDPDNSYVRDRVSYEFSNQGITIALDGSVGKGGFAAGDVLINIENLIGSKYNDHITGNLRNNYIDAGAGDDQIFGLAGDDELDGRDGDDIIDGGDGDDGLSGGAGKDTIRGGNGDDTISGGSGRNELFGDKGNDIFFIRDNWYENGGSDSGVHIIDGGEGIDELAFHNMENGVNINLNTGTSSSPNRSADKYINIENVRGSDKADIITGSNIANKIYGDEGDDQIFGLGGDDILNGGEGADIIDGGDGIDTIELSFNGSHVDLSLGKGFKNNELDDQYINIENVIGNRYDDLIIGDDKNNKIDGGGGKDIIDTRGGDDTIIAYTDNDINGGDGADRVQMVNHRNYQFNILKPDNKIEIYVTESILNNSPDDVTKFQITNVEFFDILVKGEISKTYDIKSLWSELDNTEQAKFNDTEADFLTWLGNDAGYDYFGL